MSDSAQLDLKKGAAQSPASRFIGQMFSDPDRRRLFILTLARLCDRRLAPRYDIAKGADAKTYYHEFLCALEEAVRKCPYLSLEDQNALIVQLSVAEARFKVLSEDILDRARFTVLFRDMISTLDLGEKATWGSFLLIRTKDLNQVLCTWFLLWIAHKPHTYYFRAMSGYYEDPGSATSLK